MISGDYQNIEFNQGGNFNTGETIYKNHANDNTQNTKNNVGNQYVDQKTNSNIRSNGNNNANRGKSNIG